MAGRQAGRQVLVTNELDLVLVLFPFCGGLEGELQSHPQ